MPIATWMTESCSGHMVLLPTGDADGFDFRLSSRDPEPIAMAIDADGAVVVAQPSDGSVVRVLP